MDIDIGNSFGIKFFNIMLINKGKLKIAICLAEGHY